MRRGNAELGRTGAGAKQLKNAVRGAGSRDLQLRFRAFLALFDDAGGSGEEADGGATLGCLRRSERWPENLGSAVNSAKQGFIGL